MYSWFLQPCDALPLGKERHVYFGIKVRLCCSSRDESRLALETLAHGIGVRSGLLVLCVCPQPQEQ